MGFIVVEFLFSVVDTIINTFFLEKMFGYKEGKKNIRYCFMLLYFLAAQYLMAYMIPQMVCVTFLEVLFCLLAFKGKHYEHIIWPVALNIVYCTVSSVLLPVLSLITKNCKCYIISLNILPVYSMQW